MSNLDDVLESFLNIRWDDLNQNLISSNSPMSPEQLDRIRELELKLNILKAISMSNGFTQTTTTTTVAIASNFGNCGAKQDAETINKEMPQLKERYMLLEAISKKKSDHVAVLLLHGADPYVKNRHGENAFELSEIIGDPATKSHLMRFKKELKDRENDLDSFRRGKGAERRANPFSEFPAGRSKFWKAEKKEKKEKKESDGKSDGEKSDGESDGEKSDDEKSEEEKDESEKVEVNLLEGVRNAGNTAQDVFESVRKGRLDRLKQLTIGRKFVDSRDKKQRTPLMIALKHGSDEAVQHLIDLESDMETVDHSGKSVRDYMKDRAK